MDTLFPLIVTTLIEKDAIFPHFKDEKTEAQKI